MKQRRVLGVTLALLAMPFVASATTLPLGIVRINEIAWGGAPENPYAEWIELANATDAPIDLSGWRLVSSDGAPDVLLSGTISAPSPSFPDRGYYLLERDSDDAVPGIAADQIYTGALSDAGESLSLFDAEGRLVDTANAVGDGRWPAGTSARANPPAATMERIRLDADDSPVVWATSPAPEGGTPRAANAGRRSAPVAVLRVDPPSPPPGRQAEFDATGSFDRLEAITQYVWDFGDGTGGTTSLPRVHHTYEIAGLYIVTLVVFNAAGGMSTLAHPLTVRDSTPPTADFSILSPSGRRSFLTRDPLAFRDESSDEEGPIVFWSWGFGDGATSEAQSPEHAYALAGEYLVTLDVRDAQGDAAVHTTSVTIGNRPPTARFTASSPEPHQGATVRFDATASIDEDGVLVAYDWDFDGDGVTDRSTPTPIVDAVIERCGVVQPSLTVVDDRGARSLAVTIPLAVNCAPIAQFSVSAFVVDEAAELRVAACAFDSDGDVVAHEWTFGDGGVATTQTASYTYADDGVFVVSLRVTDDRGATGATSTEITVRNLPPVVSLTVDALERETGQAFSFTASASDASPTGAIARYEWDFDGDGAIDAETTAGVAQHAYERNGTYVARVHAVDDDGAAAEASVSIRVLNRAPTVGPIIASLAAPLDTEPVGFTARAADPDGSIASWRWSFGDGAVDDTSSPTHGFDDDGVYPVHVTVTDDDGATASASLLVTVGNAAPVADFSFGFWSECPGGIAFDASASYDPSPSGWILHVAWDFGDGSVCPGWPGGCGSPDRLHPIHCYAAPGTYVVSLVVIDEQGALTTTTRSVFVPQ